MFSHLFRSQERSRFHHFYGVFKVAAWKRHRRGTLPWPRDALSTRFFCLAQFVGINETRLWIRPHSLRKGCLIDSRGPACGLNLILDVLVCINELLKGLMYGTHLVIWNCIMYRSLSGIHTTKVSSDVLEKKTRLQIATCHNWQAIINLTVL